MAVVASDRCGVHFCCSRASSRAYLTLCACAARPITRRAITLATTYLATDVAAATWVYLPPRECTYCAARCFYMYGVTTARRRPCVPVAVRVAAVAASGGLSLFVATMATVVTDWGPPDIVPAYSCLPEPVLDRLYHHPAMAAGGRGRGLLGKPVCSWGEAEIAALSEEAKTGSLLAADAAASGTYVAPSSVHGLGVFAARNIAEGEHILPFCGQLVYDDLEAATLPSGIADDSTVYGRSRLPRGLCCTPGTWKRNALEVEVHRSF